MGELRGMFRAVVAAAALLLLPAWASAQEPWRVIMPEQRNIEIRDPARLPRARLPNVPPPPTVINPQANLPAHNLTLDEAIRIGLANSKVIRVLAGQTAVSSGETIYDPAITNTTIDQARGRFDPAVAVQNKFTRAATPQALFNPLSPGQVIIQGPHIDDNNTQVGVTKLNPLGGTASLGVNADTTRYSVNGLPLNPSMANSVDLGYTQPLLQGGGIQANMAPIVIARINTERSFFQMKDTVQQMVLGVVEGYWALVFARTDAWARHQQVLQGQEGLDRAEANLAVGFGNLADVAQARAALATFKANLVSSDADVLQREAVLRNILGLPPSDDVRLVPVTAAGRLPL